MKKKHWLCLLLAVACILIFIAYRAIAVMRTDATPPKISISDIPLEISVADTKEVLLKGIAAYDAVNGDVTDSLVVESIRLLGPDGLAIVRYAAFDRAGNVAIAEREVRYTDYESPRFSLTAPLLFAQNNSIDVLRFIGASDLFDGDISHRVHATSLVEGSISALGIHNVEFRVSSSLGDTIKLVLPVEVYSTGIYSGNLALTDYLVYIQKDASFDPSSYLVSYTLGSTVTSLEGDLPEGYELELIGSVDTAVPGVYTLSYKLTDRTGPQTHTGYTKLIVIVEG